MWVRQMVGFSLFFLLNAVRLLGIQNDTLDQISKAINYNKSLGNYEIFFKKKNLDDSIALIENLHTLVSRLHSRQLMDSRYTGYYGDSCSFLFDGKHALRTYNQKFYKIKKTNDIDYWIKTKDFYTFQLREKDLSGCLVEKYDSAFIHLVYNYIESDEKVNIVFNHIYRYRLNRKLGLFDRAEIISTSSSWNQHIIYELDSIRMLADNFSEKFELSIKNRKKTVLTTFYNGDSILKEMINLNLEDSPRKGDMLPSFFLVSSENGDTVQLAMPDTGIIILDFFFTTCGPCLLMLPQLALIDSLCRARSWRFYSIDPFSNDSTLLPGFSRKYKIPYTLWRMNYSSTKLLGVYAYPTLILLVNGRIRFRHEGFELELFKKISKF